MTHLRTQAFASGGEAAGAEGQERMGSEEGLLRADATFSEDSSLEVLAQRNKLLFLWVC